MRFSTSRVACKPQTATRSFTEVLEAMREHLDRKGYTQIPQLSSMNPIDVNTKFDLVPDTATGTKRAVMIGINYVGDSPGELSGCWNDVGNMKKYIMDVHGFEEENITVLMDDGEHIEPTYNNIIRAYKKVVAESESGDAVFLHYSGEFSYAWKVALCAEIGSNFAHNAVLLPPMYRPRYQAPRRQRRRRRWVRRGPLPTVRMMYFP